MAKFHVSSAFARVSQQYFNMLGKVREGVIRPGMIVQVPFNSSFSVSETIDRIEFARKKDGSELVCLCFDCDSSDELELWSDLNIGDETLTVIEQDQH